MCIENGEGLKHCKLIAVHAGLVKGKDVEEQLKSLKAKGTHVRMVEPLSGRKSVWDIPEVMTYCINSHPLSNIFVAPKSV